MARKIIGLVREQLEDREILNYLPMDEEYVTVVLITTRRKGPYAATGLGLPSRELRSTDELIPSPAVRRRLEARLAPYRDIGRLRGFSRAVADCDVLCVNELHLASSVQAVEEKRRRPDLRVVTVCYENIAFRYDDDPLLACRRDIVRSGTDHFVALTPQSALALQTEGVQASRVSVVPYGVGFPRPQLTKEERHNKRTILGFADDDVVFLYAGRLLREKGLVPLLSALCASNHGRLLIVGAGPEEARIRRVVSVLQMEDRVRLHGWSPPVEVAALMELADVFVQPSLPTPYWEEQLGFSMIEAMASGLPILSTQSGSVSFVVGDAAILVPPYDVPALTKAIVDLHSPEVRVRLADSAVARARKYFDAEKCSSQILNALVDSPSGDRLPRSG